MKIGLKVGLGLAALILATGFAIYHLYERGKNGTYLELYGNIDIRQVDLGFRVAGKLEKMNCDEGDRVEKGQLLAELDHEPLVKAVQEADARLLALKMSYDNASDQYKRRQELIESNSISQEDFKTSYFSQRALQANVQEAEAALSIAKIQLKDSNLFAPSAGEILTRVREPGSIIKTGDPVYLLSLQSPLWVRSYIPEPKLGLVNTGMEAEIWTDTPSNPVYIGRVSFISPVAEFTPKSVETKELRSQLVYQIRVIIDKPDNKLKQGMPVTIRLPLPKPDGSR